MPRVFVLQHVNSNRGDVEDVKLIGVYSSRENAQAAMRRLGLAPGISDAPDGFHIDEYSVDQDHWVEGYVAVADRLYVMAPDRPDTA